MQDDYDSNGDLVAAVVLVVVEVGICWWIFTSLVKTYRTLRLRRNVFMLSLYRHFVSALIFSVLGESLGADRHRHGCSPLWRRCCLFSAAHDQRRELCALLIAVLCCPFVHPAIH